MINLPASISVTPPPIGDKTFEPIVLKEIDYVITYDNTAQIAQANIKGIDRVLLLCQSGDYLAAGQFSDTDVDNRVKVLLGDNPSEVLADLYINKQPYSYVPNASLNVIKTTPKVSS